MSCSEQGPEHDADSFTARPPQMLRGLYRDGGQTIDARQPADRAAARQRAGRHHARQLGHLLSDAAGTCSSAGDASLACELDEQELDRCFARVERALSVAEVTPELAGRQRGGDRRGAERLGWSHGYLRRNAKGCVGSGVCAFGCPTSAKQHTGITYVPRARGRRRQVLTGADARRVLAHGAAELAGVRRPAPPTARLEVQRPARRDRRRHDPHPVLLARSGLGAASGSSAATCRCTRRRPRFALMDERVDMARGVPQSFYVDEFAREGIMLRDDRGAAGATSRCRCR